LKNLLEQSAEESQHCSPVETVLGDVKPQELVAPTVMDLKPATNFGGLQTDCNMNTQYQSQPTMTTMDSAGNFRTITSPFEVESILPTVPMQGLMRTGSVSQLNTVVVDSNHHQILPLMSTTSMAESSAMESMVAAHSHITPLSMTVSCMEPIIKTDNTQVTSTQEVQQLQQHPANGAVAFMNGELQGTLANALTQMSDNELINYINPSCFDQGAF